MILSVSYTSTQIIFPFKVLKNFNFSLFISPTKIITSAKEKVLKTVKQLNYVKKRKKNKISQSNIAIIKCFDEKIEKEDPYFVSLKINLENKLKKNFF